MRVTKKNYPIFITFISLGLFSFAPFRLFSNPSPSEISTDEALFVRRILEFWRDKDNALVKSQINQFLAQYPQSEYKESLLVILGDSYWNEKNYPLAFKVYKSISKSPYQEKVFNNYLDCLYHLGDFREINQALHSKIKTEFLDPADQEQTLWTYYQAEALLNLAKQDANAIERAQELEQARDCFQKLLNSDHRVNAKLGLAEIESLKGNAEQVVQYYIELADDAPEKQVEMLLRAAQLQAQYEPEIALIELGKIQGLYGEYSSEAALNRLGLLLDLQRYSQIIDEEPEFFKALKTSQHPILHLYVGRSHFYLNQYDKALIHLQGLQKPECRLPNDDLSLEKSSVIMMAVCAYHLHDLNLAISLRQKFQHQFPQDPALAEMLYYEAMTLAYFQKYPEALNSFEQILTEFPTYAHKENVQYEKSVLLYKLGQWRESRTSFAELIDKKEDAKHYLPSLQYMPCISMQLLEQAENEGDPDSKKYREDLLEDLKAVLNHAEQLDGAQRSKYILQLGKAEYDLQHYQNAIETLNGYIENTPNDENLFQGHLLLALCFHEGIRDPAQFALHAEKVLNIKPGFADNSRLRMNLFNAYIELAKNSDQKDVLYGNAAEHLFLALKEGKEPIKLKNQLWLANFYYHKIRSVKQDYEIEPLDSAELATLAEKALAIYQNALIPLTEVAFTNDNLALEMEYYKISNLLGWISLTQEQKQLLIFLIQAQNNQPHLNWKLRPRALFSLANTNSLRGENDEALKNYLQVFTYYKSSDPYSISASKLKWARLAFDALPALKQTIEDPESIAILKALKDVQIHKLLLQEPIHLEAGLDYAHIRSSLEAADRQKEQHIFLLKRMKEDFTSRNDLWSKEYTEARQRYPEKNKLFEAYMTLVEAHIHLLEAQLEEQKNLALSKDNREKAKALYQKLISDEHAISKYLVHQAKSGLQQLE